ncbi:MAG: ABC-F family ATP-binding cassette domain-containing protein [Planctomycetota bacterium]
MIVCRAEKIARHYTSEPVFVDLDFQIQSGERIGLVGPNGAGKTTLIRLLNRQDQQDGGLLHFHPDASVALLAQFADFPPGQTLVAEVRAAMDHLEEWYRLMLEAGEQIAKIDEPIERGRWAKRYDQYQELLLQHGGYEFNHRIEEVLFGLGFAKVDFHRPLDTFSGGQRNRVLLAKLLLKSPDLMLLDEPTNHLDIETTEWLEDYLCKQSAAMVIVSHDRYFLDRTINKIFELHAGQLTQYPGNYHEYVKLREERAKVTERVSTKQREAISHYEDFVKKNQSGQLAKMAKSREKMIARIEENLVDQVQVIRGPAMGFGEASRTGDIVFSAKEVGKAFDVPGGKKTLFGGFTLDIERGQRLGIIGANGSGKTTLLKILLGEEQPTTGEVKRGHNLKIGYLDQDLQSIDRESTPLDVVRPPWRVAEKAEPFRAILARFGIGADLVEQKIATLSGGERTRVALARLLAFEVNVLVLDEPTNHLDLWARESLERALHEFEGTVLVVSHDRYFLNQVVDRLLWVAEEKVQLIYGNYDTYHEMRLARREKEQAAAAASAKANKPAEQATSTNKRKRKFPFRKTQDIEADIADRESKIAECENLLASPEVYKDGRRIKEITSQVEALRGELDQLMEHWEEAMELNPPT